MASPKDTERIKARHLRHKGFSLNQIVSTLKISKSSASVWVRDVKLTKKQSTFLSHNAHTQEVIKNRVRSRLKNEDAKRRRTMDTHKVSFSKVPASKEMLATLGTALYWAEGGKSPSNRIFRFSNSDPWMVKVIMCFIREVWDVPETKLKGHIHLHPHLDIKKAEKYWSDISGIPLSQFHKTSTPHNKRSTNTRDSLPHGTFNIGIYSVDLYLKMLAWIEAISEKVLAKYN